MQKAEIAGNAAMTFGGVSAATAFRFPQISVISGVMSLFSSFEQHMLLREAGKFNKNNFVVDMVTGITKYPNHDAADFVYDMGFSKLSDVINNGGEE